MSRENGHGPPRSARFDKNILNGQPVDVAVALARVRLAWPESLGGARQRTVHPPILA